MSLTLLRTLSATVIIYLLLTMAFLKLERNHKPVKYSIVDRKLNAQDNGMIDGQYKNLSIAISVIDTAKQNNNEG